MLPPAVRAGTTACATPVIANAEMRVAADRTVLSVSVEPSIVSGAAWIPTSA